VLTDRANGGYEPSKQTFNMVGSSIMNIAAHNDCSWASGSAIESSFSRGNIFYNNLAEDSAVGVTLKMASLSFLYDNDIVNNRSDGVDIAQGKTSTLFRNRIGGNPNVDVRIWSEQGPAEFDQPSVDNQLIENRLFDSKLALSLERTSGAQILGNTFVNAPEPPGVQVGAPSFGKIQYLSSWRFGKENAFINKCMGLRPRRGRSIGKASVQRGRMLSRLETLHLLLASGAKLRYNPGDATDWRSKKVKDEGQHQATRSGEGAG